MATVASQVNGMNIMLPKISYPNGLPLEMAQECISSFPDIAGIYTGMPMDEFEDVMMAASAAAKASFINECGSEFGDRRSSASPLRAIATTDQVLDISQKAVNYA